MIQKILKLAFSRVVVISLLILLQTAILLYGLIYLQEFQIIHLVLNLLSWLTILYILSRNDNPAYKIAWMIPILLVPVFGGLFYLIFGSKKLPRHIRKYMKTVYIHTKNTLQLQSDDVLQQLKNSCPDAYRQAYYLNEKALAPIYQHTTSQFLSPGERIFERMIEELRKAKKYIFMEYFIIEDGEMWQKIFAILKEKASQGVCVRLLYDDLGSIATLRSNFPKEMKKYGIQTRIFNPFKPSLDIFMNYRDHRKICVVDGIVGMTGGFNIADEYINARVKHGYWKDSAILIKGDAVWNLTILFLQLWDNQKDTFECDLLEYQPPQHHYFTDGYVQPFGDSPLDDDLIGKQAYLNIIYRAKEYIYITTPYLILDNETATALCSAAQSGIDVKIITPHIADKWFVHALTRSNYMRLIKAGVQIFEYLPGFIHSKTIVSDDIYAIVGTTNFDFRSFYLHFECGVFLYHTKSVLEVRNDDDSILTLCKKITRLELEQTNPIIKFIQMILHIFAPLM